jgi:hypothetical protein
MLLLAHAWRSALFPLKSQFDSFEFFHIYIVRRSISYAFVLNIIRKHATTGTGRIPSPTVQNIHLLIGIFIDIIMSMIYFRSARLTQRYDFWISPIAMIDHIALDCDVMMYGIGVFYAHGTFCLTLARLLGDPEEIQKYNCSIFSMFRLCFKQFLRGHR